MIRGWDVAKFLGKVQKSYLVIYDFFVTMDHEGYLLNFDVLVSSPTSKPVTLFFARGVSDQIETISVQDTLTFTRKALFLIHIRSLMILF